MKVSSKTKPAKSNKIIKIVLTEKIEIPLDSFHDWVNDAHVGDPQILWAEDDLGADSQFSEKAIIALMEKMSGGETVYNWLWEYEIVGGKNPDWEVDIKVEER